MSSSRVTFTDLKRRLDRLSGSLLPPDRAAGDYSEADQDRIHAYILLVHAEIESFIEKLAIFAADQARRKSSANKCAPVASRLLLYRAMQSKERIEYPTMDTISGACSFFEKLVDKNHGIKSINVCHLFMPLGLTHSDLDPVLMANLDTFGTYRGELAHTSARLKQGTSPSKEKTMVMNILRDLAHFDQKVRALL